MDLIGEFNISIDLCTYPHRTWQSKVGEAGAAVEAALRAGYPSIDCAHIYQNEAEIGEALQRCFKEGVVKREDIFVTSKLSYVTGWLPSSAGVGSCHFHHGSAIIIIEIFSDIYRSFDNHPELVESACRVTLKNLQLDYLDLYLIHAPFAFKKGIPTTLAAFQDDNNKLGYDADHTGKVWEVSMQYSSLKLATLVPQQTCSQLKSGENGEVL